MNKILTKQNMGRENGATLVVCLILLLLITLFGVATMQSSNLQLKMAATSKERNVGFAAAEAALVQVAIDLQNNPPLLSSMDPATCIGDCFTPTCEGGRCFSGRYEHTDKNARLRCTNNADLYSTDEIIPVLDRPELWADGSADFQTVEVTEVRNGIEIQKEVKFVLEFMCFIRTPGSGGAGRSSSPDPSTMIPLYRITSLAQDQGGKISVLLQSNYAIVGS